MSHEHIKGSDHSKQINRLKRIEGQVRGVRAMVEKQEYCVGILTQLKAARSALRSLEIQILEEHLNHCVKGALKSKDKSESDLMIAEAIEVIKKANI